MIDLQAAHRSLDQTVFDRIDQKIGLHSQLERPG
jgi:hypothetical protein